MDCPEYSHGKAGPLAVSPPASRKWEEGTGNSSHQQLDALTILQGDRHPRRIGHRRKRYCDIIKAYAVVRRLQVPAVLVHAGERHATFNPARTN
jgi:hypothetical protein